MGFESPASEKWCELCEMSKEIGRIDLSGIHALVVGLAREGIALARFLHDHGARITLTDAKPAEDLAAGIAALSGLPVTFVLGGHPPTALDQVDLVFVSPGVPTEIPLLCEARRRRIPLSSETRLFTRLCPATIVGITGSSGKTTTTALLGQILNAAGYQTWVGGNIGVPLIGHLEEMAATDVAVMELSSFQLEFFAPWPTEQIEGWASEPGDILFDPAGWSPPVAAVLNITPNHLDRHGSMEAYLAAKSQILASQRANDLAVLNLDDPTTWQMGQDLDKERRILWFSTGQEVTWGAFLRAGDLVQRSEGCDQVVCRTADLRLLGQHNLANALAACALAAALHVPIEAVRQAVTTFRGVEHRLELISETRGVRWYDDSIATTPERTVAALKAFPDAPIVLLAGGRDKHLPWHEMAIQTWRQVRSLILFGEAAGLIEEAMDASRPGASADCQIHHAGTLERAVELASRLARPGDVVLLSPGGTSFDAYRDFVARGEHYQQLVRALR
jgi:UDP-N-acetylmuramoylalanine--D-glutamate ligase